MSTFLKPFSLFLMLMLLLFTACDENLVEPESPTDAIKREDRNTNLAQKPAGAPAQVTGAALTKLDEWLQGGLRKANTASVEKSASQTAAAQATLQEYWIGFDDLTALDNVLGRAENMFALWTTRDASGNLIFCDTPDDRPAMGGKRCWTYRQPIGAADDVDVWPIVGHNHFHLSYEHLSGHDGHTHLACDTGKPPGEGAFGILVNGKCEPLDWKKPRHLDTMLPGDWVEITLTDRLTRELKWFSLQTIAVGGDKPIQLWFRKRDGSVWGWNYLDPGVNWVVRTGDAIAVWIGVAVGHDSFTLEGFTIGTY